MSVNEYPFITIPWLTEKYIKCTEKSICARSVRNQKVEKLRTSENRIICRQVFQHIYENFILINAKYIFHIARIRPRVIQFHKQIFLYILN